jgi:hypothetical protein
MWRAASTCVTGYAVHHETSQTKTQTWYEFQNDKDTLRQVVAMASPAK